METNTLFKILGAGCLIAGGAGSTFLNSPITAAGAFVTAGLFAIATAICERK